MKIKRLTFLVLAAAVVGLAITGCQKSSTASENTKMSSEKDSDTSDSEGDADISDIGG